VQGDEKDKKDKKDKKDERDKGHAGHAGHAGHEGDDSNNGDNNNNTAGVSDGAGTGGMADGSPPDTDALAMAVNREDLKTRAGNFRLVRTGSSSRLISRSVSGASASGASSNNGANGANNKTYSRTHSFASSNGNSNSNWNEHDHDNDEEQDMGMGYGGGGGYGIDGLEGGDEDEFPLDCGPSLEEPILSYKQAMRVAGFNHPCRIVEDEKEGVIFIPHPLDSSFGWFDYPFSKIFNQNNQNNLQGESKSRESTVLESYGIGITLWFKFLKAFSVIFFVMFFITFASTFLFWNGTHYNQMERKYKLESAPTELLFISTMGNVGVTSTLCFTVTPGEEVIRIYI
jgi:hypothetical protein